MSDAKWRWFDKTLGDSNHLALGRFTFADLLMFAFANFGFTIGWKLPEGTDNLARFVETHNQRECAGIFRLVQQTKSQVTSKDFKDHEDGVLRAFRSAPSHRWRASSGN